MPTNYSDVPLPTRGGICLAFSRSNELTISGKQTNAGTMTAQISAANNRFARNGLMLAGALLVLAPWTTVAQRPIEDEVVWPLPPETPRIRYSAVLYSDRDLGKKKSLFARVSGALAGTKDNAIVVQRPHDVYVDHSGRIFLTNGQASGFWVFDPNQKEARLVVPEGVAALGKPMGIAGDGDGLIYIADSRHRRVVALDADGNYAQAYGGPSEMLNPVDVATSPFGDRVYVVDSHLHQLLVYTRDGALVKRIGRDVGDLARKAASRASTAHRLTSIDDSTDIPGHEGWDREPSDMAENRGILPSEFRYPAFVAVAPDGTVYVSDGLNFRVQAFDPEGEFLFEFGGLGNGPGSFARPKGVSVDNEGHVYVVDAAFNNVQIFDAQGQLLLAFGGHGNGAGQLWLPVGISIDTENRIFVADRVNNRIQIYEYLLPSAPITTVKRGSP